MIANFDSALWLEPGTELFKIGAKHWVDSASATEMKDKVKELSLKYEVISGETAFFAASKKKQTISEIMTKVNVNKGIVH